MKGIKRHILNSLFGLSFLINMTLSLLHATLQYFYQLSLWVDFVLRKLYGGLLVASIIPTAQLELLLFNQPLAVSLIDRREAALRRD